MPSHHQHHETVRDPVHQPLPITLSIYEEGRAARKKGAPTCDCPYLNPRNIHSWITGWKHEAEGLRLSDGFADLIKAKG